MSTTNILTAAEALSPNGPLYGQIARLAMNDPARSPSWLRAWYDAYGHPDSDPVVILGCPDGHMLPEAVLALTRIPDVRLGAVRYLITTTNGNSDYAGLLIRPGAREDALPALLDALLNRHDWDVLRMVGLSADQAAQCAAWAHGFGLSFESSPTYTSPILVLGSDRLRSLPPRNRSTQKRERALRKLGHLGFRAHDKDENLLPLLDRYLEAEARSWKAGRNALIRNSPSSVEFYRGLIRAPASDLQVYIHFLLLDGAIIAGHLSAATQQSLVCLKTFFDDNFFKYSVGSVLEHMVLEHICNSTQVNSIDFNTRILHYGQFATKRTALVDVAIWHRHSRGRVLRLLRTAVNRMRGRPSSVLLPRPAGGRNTNGSKGVSPTIEGGMAEPST